MKQKNLSLGLNTPKQYKAMIAKNPQGLWIIRKLKKRKTLNKESIESPIQAKQNLSYSHMSTGKMQVGLQGWSLWLGF